MRNRELWKPSKYIPTAQGWRGSDDPQQLMAASRLLGDILARRYASLIELHACGRLLDHGCGQVPLFGMYKDLVDEVITVDWPNSIHPKADCACKLNMQMPFADATFDTIIS
jgi:hypothetical protein